MGGEHLVSVSAAVREATEQTQRYHADTITAAKTAETRQRRVDEALALLQEGEKR